MDSIIERAKAEAEQVDLTDPDSGPPAKWDEGYDYGFRKGVVYGAAFAATITPEQVEAGAEVLFEGTYPGCLWSMLPENRRATYRDLTRAAARAMGLEVSDGE